ncbi:MAG: OprD family outer membrane porin [Sulfuricurvum sp.]|jgi:hypothetical protein
MKKNFLLLSLVTASSLFAGSDLSSAFQEGKVSGQIRYDYMDENNKGNLKDYYGSAVGGYLKYETGALEGFKAGAAIYAATYLSDDVSSTNTESTAGKKGSRYVAGLMDASDLDKNEIMNLGEAYISYQKSKTKATVGRMKLNTPFINPEDGRMIPTFEQGIWVTSKDIQNYELQAGYINAFWNRSTSDWKSVQDSFGYGYPQGKAPTGANANYGSGNIDTNGVYVASIAYSGIADTKLELWDYYIQNIFNLGYFEGNYNKQFGNFRVLAGAQYISEQEVGNGGNDDRTKAYMDHGEKSETYGAKAGIGYTDTLLTLASTTTTDEGRFLFPREWGKEPLFTFQKRERSDGSGGSDAWLVTLDQDFKAIGLDGLSLKVGYGRYHKPDAKNATLNKFGIPSYAQTNIDLFYTFKGPLKGLVVEYLFTKKSAIGNTYETPTSSTYVFTKNDMNIQNLILNYNF